jgi:threonine dehydrogenase-like Zn-dependent dehydrogenase
VTDINRERLDFAASRCTPEDAAKRGCELTYLNTSGMEDPVKALLEISRGGFDDVFVMAPLPELFSMAERVCREDGCVNFFAGPARKEVPGSLNLYRIHYDGIHVVGTTGSVPEDTVEIIRLIERGNIRPGAMVSHILGLNAVPEAIFAMEKPSGAKKVCYTGLDIPLTAIADFGELGKTDPLYRELDAIVRRNGGLWCAEAERYLLAHAPKI